MARPAIDAGAWYLSSRMRIWTEPRPAIERRRLGEACYNAGCGHIINAQRLCRSYGVLDCRDWHQIGLFLPAVTGRHAAETLSYVASIEHWQQAMRSGGIR
jgi:membrane-bound lytic murein transglycosylase F